MSTKLHLCVLSALAIGFSHTTFAEHNETVYLGEVDVTASKVSSTTQPNIDEAREVINKTAGGVGIVATNSTQKD